MIGDARGDRMVISTIRDNLCGVESAGQLLRAARQKGHLTQVQLATRAGVTQSVISAYESGRRHPALDTLAALVQATGYELDISLRAKPTSAFPGPLGVRVLARRDDIVAAAAEVGVTNLRLFGSVARGEENGRSDVDLLGEFPPTLGLFALGRLVARLEDIVGTRVDLIPSDDLKAPVRALLERDLIPL